MLTSLRARLIAGAFIGTLLVSTAAAAFLYSAIRASLVGEFDAGLNTRAQALVNMTEVHDRRIRLDLDAGQRAQFGQPHPNDGFVLLTADGRMMAKIDPPGGSNWWKAAPLGGQGPSFDDLVLPSGARGRCIAMRFTPHVTERDWPLHSAPLPFIQMVVLGDTRELAAKLHRLAGVVASTFALTTLFSALVLSLVIRRGLSPLGLLASRIEGVGKDDLFRRVDVGNPPEEIRPVVQRLNELLVRLESSFPRERAFTADVAHELRTPLAGLMTALEVSSSRPREAPEYQQTIRQCLGASRSMRSMVETLLTLARADARQISAHRQPVDLPVLIYQTWQPFAARATFRKLTVNWSLDPTAVIQTDPALLGAVLSNLFDNAVSYTNEGGWIDVQANRTGTTLFIRITNTGSDVAAADAGKVFERFWRGDTARTGSGEHFGLGLALCQRIITLLSATIAISTAKNAPFAATIEWPSEQSQNSGQLPATAPG